MNKNQIILLLMFFAVWFVMASLMYCFIVEYAGMYVEEVVPPDDSVVKYCVASSTGIRDIGVVPIDYGRYLVLRNGSVLGVVMNMGDILYGFNNTTAEKYSECIEKNIVVDKKFNVLAVVLSMSIPAMMLLLVVAIRDKLETLIMASIFVFAVLVAEFILVILWLFGVL